MSLTLPTYGMGDRTALWPDRWPLIALQTCIDQIDAAPKDEKDRVRWALPCESCPENTACLNAKQKEIGGLLYDREIRTQPRSSASSLFPYDTMETLFNRKKQLVPYYNKPHGMEDRYVVVSGWDIAWSEKSGGDYLAKFTALLDKRNGLKTILDIDRWQRVGFQEQALLIEEHWNRYKDDLVVIEDAFAQKVWIQYISSTTQVPVIGHGAGGKQSFKDGVPGLLMDIERKMWEVPFAVDGRNHGEVKNWLSECEAFGWEDDRLEGVGEHDDTVMAWYHCNWGLEKLRRPPMRESQSERARETVEF